MANTVYNSIYFAQPFIQYSPLTAGIGFEPALSAASIIRNTIMDAPFTWPWARLEDSSTTTVAGTQDYTINLTNFSYLEKVALTNSAGSVWEIKDVINTAALAKLTTVYTLSVAGAAVGPNTSYTGVFPSQPPIGSTVYIAGFANATNNGAFVVVSCNATTLVVINAAGIFETLAAKATYAPSVQRPTSVCVLSYIPGVSVNLRFIGVPEQAYLITCTYQQLPPPFGSYVVTACSNVSAGNTTYTGVFTAANFLVGGQATIAGLAGGTANNGTFTIVSCNGTSLVLANPNGTAESTQTATAVNSGWYPIPDSFSDIYNNLFLADAFDTADDARAQLRRTRGIAALLSKAEGLTEMQINIFLQKWDAGNRQTTAGAIKTQQGQQARGN